jgi:hypothetical protein
MPVSLASLNYYAKVAEVVQQPVSPGQSVLPQPATNPVNGFVYVTVKSDVDNTVYITVNGRVYMANSGIPITGGAGYTFKIPASGGALINVSFQTGATVTVTIEARNT